MQALPIRGARLDLRCELVAGNPSGRMLEQQPAELELPAPMIAHAAIGWAGRDYRQRQAGDFLESGRELAVAR